MKSKLFSCFCFFILSSHVLSSELSEGDILHPIRAQFVYNFINYVFWPDEAFHTKESTIDVCLFGYVGFEGHLRAFEGVSIGGHELNIITTEKKSDIENGCHLLFVSEEKRIELPKFWSEINHLYVLSVGEKSEFAEKGGVISIFRTQDRMQFDINISNAINNGLALDSDLLALARVLRGNPSASVESDLPSDASSEIEKSD